jgi:HPr kinase/phosphorylase
MESKGIELARIVKRFSLENLTPELDLADRWINHFEINRPALQLTGFYEYFDHVRVQIIGRVENSYLNSQTEEKRKEIFTRLFSKQIPCLIICRGIHLSNEADILAIARDDNVPVLRTDRSTSGFVADLIRYLNYELAPSIALHGGLVDCFGEGVFIMGESGVGKSETALELIQRGHRLVADDVVEIKKISDTELIGSCPEVIRNLLELRGIGVVDIKELYGVQSVKQFQSIDMVVKLENWEKGNTYNRMGLEDDTIEILGNQVVCYSIPIRAGRNMAVIIETAAINHRQKKMGYNAAEALQNRVTGNMIRAKQEKQGRRSEE